MEIQIQFVEGIYRLKLVSSENNSGFKGTSASWAGSAWPLIAWALVALFLLASASWAGSAASSVDPD